MPEKKPEKKNDYYTIDTLREKTIKVRRSIFTCQLAPVDSIDTAKIFISKISKANKQANHNCWAYIIGDTADVFHSSDAGEPSGTAGKPMLQTLQSCNITQIAAVVTRYFGGVKLGVRGLIDAYSQSVQETLDMTPLRKIVHTVTFEVELAYDFNELFLSRIQPIMNRIVDTQYSDKIVHTIEIERSHLETAEQWLSDLKSQKKLSYQLSPSF